MANLPTPTTTVDSILLMGSKLKADIKENVTHAELSMSTSQVTQLSITMVDPNFRILKSGLFKIGTPVRYKDLNFTVSNTETTSINGNEGLTIKCRPQIVTKLKARTGTKVMKKTSPSDFVKSECKAVGAKYYVQSSSKRTSVARDKPKAKEKYESDERPSSWTTFTRLASELGFVLFEIAGVIYFGKPSYLLNAAKKSAMRVTWNTGTVNTLSESVPQCVKSVDSAATTVQVTLPPQRAKECRVGRAIKLSGVPTFDGYYLITDVDYSLSGNTDRISLSASTPVDPEANPPTTKSGTKTVKGKDGTIYKIVTGTSKGSWPISRKYRVGTPFGRRGSWAAGYHTGADFPAPTGVPVYAVYSGTISIGGWGSEYGNHVILKVGSKRFAYCHLSKIKVHSGQSVKSGQILGYVGATGRAFGSHLHLEYRTPPYRYGKDSHNPLPQLSKTITTTRKVKVSSATKYSSGASGSKSANAFVSKALTRKGDRYVFGATRNTASNIHVFDCSSLVRWALAQVGIPNFPMTTYSQKPYLARKGQSISVETAARTRGAVMYTRSLGHVAISLGNGMTIEAANSRVGVVSYSARGRGFYYCYKIPGLRY